jgi:carbon storage regulator
MEGETMLVLSRKLGESIEIGDGVTVTIVGIYGRTVRVGIQAPMSVRIVRSELVQDSEEGAKEQIAGTASAPSSRLDRS